MAGETRKGKKRANAAARLETPRANAPEARGRTPLHVFGLALFVLATTRVVFQPALDGQWLSWDDDQLLLERTEWRGLGITNLAWMFTTFHMGPYQPLAWISYAFDHATAGLDPRAYHATNVWLHAASAAVLYLAARRLFALVARRTGWSTDSRRERIGLEVTALASALAWGLHPLRVESVAWITERRDCLSALFLLCAFHAWLAHVEGNGRRGRAYWLAFLAFAASLLSKGLGLAFPLVLLLLDAWPLLRLRTREGERAARRFTRLVLEKAPFLALSGLAAVLAIVGQRVTGAMVRTETHDLGARVVQSFHGLAFYVRKSIWPDDLMVLYPMRVPLDPWEPRFVVSIAAVVLGVIAVVLLRRRVPGLAVALAAYALFVAPVLGLVQTGSQLAADRYAHLATIPLALLGGGFVLGLARREPRVAWLALVPCVPLALATRAQIPVWRDTVSLWTHDLAIDPRSNPARRGLMTAYEHLGRAAADPSERLRHFERALEVCRDDAAAGEDAACLAQAAKLLDVLAGEHPSRRPELLAAALDHALRSVLAVERTTQRLPEAYESAGVVLAELGRPAEAVPYLEKLVALTPNDPGRLGMLGEVLMQAGRFEEALVPLERARALAPDMVIVHLDLGDAYRRLGRREEAIAAYRGVLALRAQASGDPDRAAAVQALRELGAGP